MGKKYLYIRLDFIKHHFKLELVDSGLYFVKDEINFIYPLLQVGFGSGSGEKSTGSGRPKIDGSDSSSLVYIQGVCTKFRSK